MCVPARLVKKFLTCLSAVAAYVLLSRSRCDCCQPAGAGLFIVASMEAKTHLQPSDLPRLGSAQGGGPGAPGTMPPRNPEPCGGRRSFTTGVVR